MKGIPKLKIKLPARSDKPRSARAGLSLFRLTSVLVVLSGIAVLALVYLAQTDVNRERQREIDTRDQLKAANLGQAISNSILKNKVMVATLAGEYGQSHGVIDDTAPAAREHEALVKALFPDARRVMLLPGNIAEVADVGQFPKLSFADLDLIASSESEADLEVHLPNTPAQHIDFVSSLGSDAKGQRRGYLLVSLPPRVVNEALAQIKPLPGYAEIVQKSTPGSQFILARGGDKQSKHGAPVVVSLSGTRWLLRFWGTRTIAGAEAVPFLWVAGAVAWVLITLIAIVLHRLVSRAVRDDLQTVIAVVRDTVRGTREMPRPVTRLAEFSGVFKVLGQLQAGRKPVATVAAEKRDVETGDRPQPEARKKAPQGPAAAPGTGKTPKMAVSSGVFKAYDIRGIVGKELSPKFVEYIGKAIGSEAYDLGQQSIVIARDGRLSGAELIESLSKGIRSSGRDVIGIGLVPTPVLYFATHYMSTASGVMLTGSHNPPEYNGMKIVLRGETLSGDAIQKLRRRVEQGDFQQGEGSVKTIDLLPDYIERITSDIHLNRSLKVVVDCGNGAAGEAAPRLLRALGCEVIELYCDIDGHFPNHHPDPSQPDNLKDLIREVRQKKADLGLAFDGDGDRLGVISARGEIIWPDRQMMLYAKDVLSRHPSAEIIYDVKCSRHLARVISESGGTPVMWKTGHSLIKARMKETGALLAGEMSGHIFFKERWFGFDDALYTAARLLEILSHDRRPTDEIFAALPDALSTPELRIEMEGRDHHAFMKQLEEKARFPGAAVTDIDGLRVDFEDGWGLVRASNTTPCLVLRFEADNSQALKRIQNAFGKLLLTLDPKLQLPF